MGGDVESAKIIRMVEKLFAGDDLRPSCSNCANAGISENGLFCMQNYTTVTPVYGGKMKIFKNATALDFGKNCKKMGGMKNEVEEKLMRTLDKLTADLSYPSEADSIFKITYLGRAPDFSFFPVMTLDDFFRPVLNASPYNVQCRSDEQGKWIKLYWFIINNLTNIIVIKRKLNDCAYEYQIQGKTEDDNYISISTTAVET